MENHLFINEINLLDKQISSYKEEKDNYISKKKNEINELSKIIENNNIKIISLKKKLDLDKKSLLSINKTKETKLKSLLPEIEKLENQINILQNQNIITCDKDIELLNNEIINMKSEKQKLEKKIKFIKKKIYILEQRQNEENERNNMLKEEYFSCKKLLIMLTSKIESHSEFIKTLCKSKNEMTSSLEKLNEIDPDNSEFSNNVIEMNKLAEMIYSYCNEYLEFNTTYDGFIEKIKNQDDIDKVIDYLQEVSKHKISKNLFEYILIALCRIMTYEKILDLRMKFMNNIDKKEEKEKNINKDNNEKKEKENINEDKNEKNNNIENNKKNISNDKLKKNSSQMNNLILYKKEYEIYKLKLENSNKNLINKENILKKINIDKKENIDNINKMINDLSLMTKYRNKLSEKLDKKEKNIKKREKEYLESIDKLNNEIISCKEKLIKKNMKLKENSDNLDNKLNELIKIRDGIIKTNNIYKSNSLNDNLLKINPITNNNLNSKSDNIILKIEENNDENNIETEDKNSIVSITQLIQSNNSIKSIKLENEVQKYEENKNNTNNISINISKILKGKDYISIQNIKSLFTEIEVLKRQIIHIKKKIYSNYNPVINNKSTLPQDYDFKKYILYLDNSLDKIHFDKINSTDRSLAISPTSILRLEIPVFTKNLIFLQKIYSNLNKKLNLDTTKKINEYFIKEKSTIIKLYHENFEKNNKENNNIDMNLNEINENVDEKIFDEKYREALLINKQYMINIYLKPEEDTKIEILFQTRNDFKNWINGLDELVSNYRKIKDIINGNINT